jgi:pSer/pThr/pTyr-binding forkhead associated (FHA) protein
VIYDLVSANGVSVNGEAVERRALHNGDRILVGQSELGFMQVRKESESAEGEAREDETVDLGG